MVDLSKPPVTIHTIIADVNAFQERVWDGIRRINLHTRRAGERNLLLDGLDVLIADANRYIGKPQEGARLPSAAAQQDAYNVLEEARDKFAAGLEAELLLDSEVERYTSNLIFLEATYLSKTGADGNAREANDLLSKNAQHLSLIPAPDLANLRLALYDDTVDAGIEGAIMNYLSEIRDAATGELGNPPIATDVKRALEEYTGEQARGDEEEKAGRRELILGGVRQIYLAIYDDWVSKIPRDATAQEEAKQELLFEQLLFEPMENSGAFKEQYASKLQALRDEIDALLDSKKTFEYIQGKVNERRDYEEIAKLCEGYMARFSDTENAPQVRAWHLESLIADLHNDAANIADARILSQRIGHIESVTRTYDDHDVAELGGLVTKGFFDGSIIPALKSYQPQLSTFKEQEPVEAFGKDMLGNTVLVVEQKRGYYGNTEGSEATITNGRNRTDLAGKQGTVVAYHKANPQFAVVLFDEELNYGPGGISLGGYTEFTDAGTVSAPFKAKNFIQKSSNHTIVHASEVVQEKDPNLMYQNDVSGLVGKITLLESSIQPFYN